MEERGDWYSNKELYEMMVNLSKGLEATNAELAKTQVMIRDYNGLRERVDENDRKYAQIVGQQSGGKDMWGYIVGAIGLIMALIAAIAR